MPFGGGGGGGIQEEQFKRPERGIKSGIRIHREATCLCGFNRMFLLLSIRAFSWAVCVRINGSLLSGDSRRLLAPSTNLTPA